MWSSLNFLRTRHLRLHFVKYLGDSKHTFKTEEKKEKKYLVVYWDQGLGLSLPYNFYITNSLYWMSAHDFVMFGHYSRAKPSVFHITWTLTRDGVWDSLGTNIIFLLFAHSRTPVWVDH